MKYVCIIWTCSMLQQVYNNYMYINDERIRWKVSCMGYFSNLSRLFSMKCVLTHVNAYNPIRFRHEYILY